MHQTTLKKCKRINELLCIFTLGFGKNESFWGKSEFENQVVYEPKIVYRSDN